MKTKQKKPEQYEILKKIYNVSLSFLYDDEEYPDIKNKYDAIQKAINEINEQGTGGFYFDVTESEVILRTIKSKKGARAK